MLDIWERRAAVPRDRSVSLPRSRQSNVLGGHLWPRRRRDQGSRPPKRRVRRRRREAAADSHDPAEPHLFGSPLSIRSYKLQYRPLGLKRGWLRGRNSRNAVILSPVMPIPRRCPSGRKARLRICVSLILQRGSVSRVGQSAVETFWSILDVGCMPESRPPIRIFQPQNGDVARHGPCHRGISGDYGCKRRCRCTEGDCSGSAGALAVRPYNRDIACDHCASFTTQ